MKEFEFVYSIRDGFQSYNDDEIFSTEVVRGENKILAEEAFLDILKDRNVDVSMVIVISCNELPIIEEEECHLEEEEEVEDELYGEEDYE